MTPDAILKIITARVHPDLRHKVDESATFDDLHLCIIDAWGIAFDIEEDTGRELHWNVEQWTTVADVIGAAGEMEEV